MIVKLKGEPVFTFEVSITPTEVNLMRVELGGHQFMWGYAPHIRTMIQEIIAAKDASK